MAALQRQLIGWHKVGFNRRHCNLSGSGGTASGLMVMTVKLLGFPGDQRVNAVIVNHPRSTDDEHQTHRTGRLF
jgi:hypothetical protein